MASAFDRSASASRGPRRSPDAAAHPVQGLRRAGIPCIAAGAIAVAAATWWAAAPRRAASPVLPEPASRSMHVAEVVPTDSAFREPQRAFGPASAYWRVSILDARAAPVVAAYVTVDLVGPDAAVCAHLVAVTGDDGAALFSYALGRQPPGVYTVRVVNVSHADSDTSYDRAANVASANSFSATTP